MFYSVYRTLVLVVAGGFFMAHNHVFTSLSGGLSALIEGVLGGSLLGLGIGMLIEDLKSN